MQPDVFDQVFGVISENANSGAQGSGAVADWLIRAGLSAAAISQILNGVAESSAASPEIIAYTQQEMRYLQDSYYRPRTNWAPLLIGAAVLYAILNSGSRAS